MGRLKVLIIGGSVTGLTLAAIFERYGIDYALLEKHADVTPALGASIGLLAHGSRVLDQLGCFEELLPFGNGIENMDMYDPDGKKMGCHKNLGTYMESM
jgi:2-polyprenyl-6-methoxyphenol hydroxylase-like FAD-dependent oxidoreductase